MRNLQELVKKAFCYQKLFCPFTVWINCSSDLKMFANSRPSASNFKKTSRSLEQCLLTVGQNNFGNKVPILDHSCKYSHDRIVISLLKKIESMCLKIPLLLQNWFQPIVFAPRHPLQLVGARACKSGFVSELLVFPLDNFHSKYV